MDIFKALHVIQSAQLCSTLSSDRVFGKTEKSCLEGLGHASLAAPIVAEPSLGQSWRVKLSWIIFNLLKACLLMLVMLTYTLAGRMPEGVLLGTCKCDPGSHDLTGLGV